VMLFVTVAINFLDRSNLSVAAPLMRVDLGLNTLQMGFLLSAFGWTYAFCQIPGGWLVDRVSPRTLYPILLILWSVATILLGLVGSLAALVLLRLCVGALEAPSYPTNNRVVTTWFPESERAGAIGFYTSAQFLGLAFLTPFLLWLQATWSWHWVFIFTGALGLAWGAVWFLAYREPRHFALANSAEVDFIQNGGGMVDGIPKRKDRTAPTRNDWLAVLANRKLWGLYLGQYSVTTCQWFFLSWFPTYLAQARGFSLSQSAWYAALPFLAAFVGVLSSGMISDKLLRNGVSLDWARKGPIITGLLLSSSIIGANFVDQPEYIIGFMTVAFFGNGMASISWSLVSPLAPRHLVGLTGGTFNFISQLSGIATPLIIGYLAMGGNFAPGLLYVGGVGMMGALSYIFLIGKVERREPPAGAS